MVRKIPSKTIKRVLVGDVNNLFFDITINVKVIFYKACAEKAPSDLINSLTLVINFSFGNQKCLSSTLKKSLTKVRNLCYLKCSRDDWGVLGLLEPS